MTARNPKPNLKLIHERDELASDIAGLMHRADRLEMPVTWRSLYNAYNIAIGENTLLRGGYRSPTQKRSLAGERKDQTNA